MATTLTLTKATPHSLAYTMTGDGVAGTRTGAQLVLDCVAGPLRNLLRRLNAGGFLQRLNLDNGANISDTMGKVRIRHVEGINALQTTPATRTIVWAAHSLDVTSAAGVSQIEIRFTPSSER
jgi:hypothetical protein